MKQTVQSTSTNNQQVFVPGLLSMYFINSYDSNLRKITAEEEFLKLKGGCHLMVWFLKCYCG